MSADPTFSDPAAPGPAGPAGPAEPAGPGAAPESALAALFAETGVPAGLAGAVAGRLGPRAAELLRADPWRLLLVPGVRHAQADHFAARVLGPAAGPAHPRRGPALVVHLLAEAARRGHTAMPAAEMAAALAGLGVPDPAPAVEAALDEADVLAFVDERDEPDGAVPGADADPDAEPAEPGVTLAPARIAFAEEAAAEALARLAATAERLIPRESTADLPDAQLAAFVAGVSVLHGDPWAVRAAVRALAGTAAAHGLRVVIAAPTDRAAAEYAGPPEGAGEITAGGLHRLLEPVPGPEFAGYARGEQRPLEAELVIAADAGVLDVEQAAALAEGCADGTHLVLCGDPAGLPPAGPGRVLADVAASDAAPVIELPPVPDAGPVAEPAAQARLGRLAQVSAPDREVVVVPAGDDAAAVRRAVQLVTDSIPRALGIAAADVQVLSPADTGRAGAAALNVALKAALNPGPGALAGFDPGDRVVLSAASPAAAVGETGTVTGGTPGALRVAFPAGEAVVPAGRLRHGWAITVRRAAGTRWPAVVAVLPGPDGAAGAPLPRPLVVTAFGRALRHLSVVHAAGPGLARSVRDVTAAPRRTRLAGLLKY